MKTFRGKFVLSSVYRNQLSGNVMSHYFLTALAMFAFATNSVLCKLALGDSAIDAASFTVIRLSGGAMMLSIILLYRNHSLKIERIRPLPVLMLFTYAICFSFSYVGLTTATGALILFGTVQLTMILFGFVKGERLGVLSWMGIVCAATGMIYLLMPGAVSPPLVNAVLMIIAGISWAIYSLCGKNNNRPLLNTCWNFIGTIPLVLLTCVAFYSDMHMNSAGLMLAMASGAVASALGYVVWYSALPYLSSSSVGSVQLSVPIIAALGGVLLVDETVTLRLVIASVIVLGGIYMAVMPENRKTAGYDGIKGSDP